MTTIPKLLSEHLEARQKINPRYSLRAFAKSLGISPSHLSLLMAGKRGFSRQQWANLVKRLNLSEEEALSALIGSNALPLREEGRPARELSEKEFEGISDWYHYAILSLTHVKGAKADPAWIAKRLGIPIALARQALRRLSELGFLRTDSGRFEQCPNRLVTGGKIPSSAIRSFHRQILQLNADALERVHFSRRRAMSLTVALDESELPAVTKALEDAQKKILRIANKKARQFENVFSISFYAIPLTCETSNSSKKALQ